MPRYKITDPNTGKTLRLTGDSPPTEQELNQIFSSVSKPVQNASSPSILGTVSKMIEPSMSFSPQGLIAGGYAKARSLFPKAGQYVAEQFAEKGVPYGPMFSGRAAKVSPEVAAGLGTAVSMAPDIAEAAITPFGASKGVVKGAVPLARRALGFQKSFLKTPFARGQATKAAEMALEKGVIPPLGSPTVMAERAGEIATKSGEQIGGVLKKTPIDVNKVFDDLEGLRGQITQGAEKGVFATANKAIDDIQTNIIELSSQARPLAAKAVNSIKTRLGQSLNYLSDLASQSDNKAIQNSLANSIRDAVKSFTTPEEFSQFLANQKQYSAAQLMLKGLNNEIAGQMGNAAVSLPSTILGAGRLAAGDIPGAVASSGLMEAAKRRGAGIGAILTQDVSRATPAALYTGGRVGVKVLDEQTALKILDEAGGDIERARQIAQQRGYRIPINTQEPTSAR